MTIHQAALRGFSTASDAYDRGRPEYPQALLDWLERDLGARQGTRIADIGAGTGKFTRLLLNTGAGVSAIEPVDAMRERLTQALGVPALAGTAEAIPLPPESLDAIVCAQAFHWFANDDALREFRRVLRPGGRLGLIWNVRDESLDWVAAITRIITPYEGDAPRYHTGRWRQPFEQQTLFSAPRCSVFTHTHVGSFEQVVMDRFMSVSFIAALPEADQRQVRSELQALPERFAVLQAASIAFPYRTEAWLSERA